MDSENVEDLLLDQDGDDLESDDSSVISVYTSVTPVLQPSMTPMELWNRFGNEGLFSILYSISPSSPPMSEQIPTCSRYHNNYSVHPFDSPTWTPLREPVPSCSDHHHEFPVHYADSAPASSTSYSYRPIPSSQMQHEQILTSANQTTGGVIVENRRLSEPQPTSSPEPDITEEHIFNTWEDSDGPGLAKRRRFDAGVVEEASVDLYSLARAGKFEVAEKILETGVQIDPPGRGETVLLHEAVKWGRRRMTELLLNRGANINALDKHGKNILRQAIRHKRNPDINGEDQVAILKILLMNGALINNDGCLDNELYKLSRGAIKHGSVDALRIFLRFGFKLNLLNSRKNNPKQKPPPLHLAVYNKDVKVLEYLLDSALFDIDQQDNMEQTALHVAVSLNRKPHIKLLLERKVNIDIKDHRGRTALDLALCNERIDEAVEMLLRSGTGIGMHLNDALHIFAKSLNICVRIRGPWNEKKLIKHIALLKSYDYLAYSFDEYTTGKFFPMNSSLSEFFNKCMAEIKIMQSYTFYDSYTIYDLLSDTVFDKCAKLLQPIAVTETMREVFPLYSEYIAEKIDLILNERKLRSDAKIGLHMILKMNVEGYHLIYDRILANLSHKDFRSLRAITLGDI